MREGGKCQLSGGGGSGSDGGCGSGGGGGDGGDTCKYFKRKQMRNENKKSVNKWRPKVFISVADFGYFQEEI